MKIRINAVTKREPTAKDIAKFGKDKIKVYQSTFEEYCKAQVGRKYKDFLGRQRTWALDSESDVRSTYYFWNGVVKLALKYEFKVPTKVKNDWSKRAATYKGSSP